MLLQAEPQMGVFSSFPEEKHGNFLGSVLRATGDYLQHKSAHRGVLLVYSLFDHLLCQNHILQTNVPDSWMFCLEKQWYSALLKKKKVAFQNLCDPCACQGKDPGRTVGSEKRWLRGFTVMWDSVCEIPAQKGVGEAAGAQEWGFIQG